MATTATNKQPLLIDRVFHNTVQGNTLTSGSDSSLDIVGTNESAVLVNCTSNDGGIVEELYAISRTGTGAAYEVMFYFSPSIDYLRPSEATYVGSITTSTTEGEVTAADSLPRVLAPLPNTGSDAQLRALYVPKGMVLWTTLKLAGPANTSDTPIIGAQGGFY